MNDDASQLLRVHELYHQGKIEETLQLCDELLKGEPRASFKAQLIRRKGDCFHKMGHLNKALELYEEAMFFVGEKDLGRGWILESKASTLKDLGRYEEALKAVLQSMELAEDHLDVEHLQEMATEIMDEALLAQEEEIVRHYKLLIEEQTKQRISQLHEEHSQDEVDELLRNFPRLVS